MKIHFVIDMDRAASEFCPHLGVAYLSAYIKRHVPGIDVALSYMSDDLLAEFTANRPDIAAFSSTSRFFGRMSAAAARVHETLGIPVIWGGVHVTIAPGDLPEFAAAGVLGEGEETLLDLVNRFTAGRFDRLSDVDGIVYRENGDLKITQKRAFIRDIDSIPHPDVDLLKVGWNRLNRAVMVTSRGCPYKCRFCASSLFWDRTRLHSADYVISEMKYIVETFGVEEILVYDDFFSIDKRRIAQIALLKQADRALKNIRLECLSRVDNFDEELAASLKEAGVFRLTFGIESGCQKTLNYLKNDKVTLDQVVRAVGIARKYGIKSIGSFIIGSPYETADEIIETYDFIKKLRLDKIQIGIATPFPGTELWNDGMKIGRITGEEWSDDYDAMFHVVPGVKAREALAGKALITQINLEKFYALVDEGIKLQNRINLTFANWLRYYTRQAILRLGMTFLLKKGGA